MSLDYKIIGIGGNARSGKDTLGSYFVKILADQGIKAKTYSFANELKKSVDDFLIREIGISAFTEDEGEKKIIRPFLVFWGTDIMRKINDNVWVEKIEPWFSGSIKIYLKGGHEVDVSRRQTQRFKELMSF